MQQAFRRNATAGFWAMVAAAALTSFPIRASHAEDSLGVYVGAAVGLAEVNANVGAPQGDLYPAQTGEFQGNQFGFKFVAGIRPLRHVGAEIEYVDFGRASGNDFGYPANLSQKGPAAFAVFYLPMASFDLYAKLGVASLQNSFSGSAFFYGSGSPFQSNQTTTGGAAGLGVQFDLGSWEMRAEYEQFSASGSDPGLLSVGALWRF